MLVKVYHNGDDLFIAWKADGPIDDCRGFALMRRRNGLEEVVSTWVGFAGQRHKQGERRASTNWPIQRYQWTDYMANPRERLQYRVVPMVGPDRDNLRACLARGILFLVPNIYSMDGPALFRRLLRPMHAATKNASTHPITRTLLCTPLSLCRRPQPAKPEFVSSLTFRDGLLAAHRCCRSLPN